MPKGYNMKRYNVCLSDQQNKQLKKLQKETGLSRSELIRRAIDDFVKKQNKEKTT